MVTYDVHAHIVPPALAAAIRSDGSQVGIELAGADDAPVLLVGEVSRGRVHAGLLDVEARLRAMDVAGVDIQLLSAWVGLMAYGLPTEPGVRWSRLFNETLAELVGSHPGRFLGLALAPLQAPIEAAGELRRAVTELDLVGVEITTTVNGSELDDERLEPFWSAANDLRCLVLVHPDRALPGRTKPRHRLANTVGNAAETTVAAVSLACGGVLERHPDLRICLVHGGGYVPYQVGRLDHAYAATPEQVAGQLPHPPSHYLRRLYYDTVTHSPAALRFLIDFAGSDHVVLGSDYPFEMADRTPLRTLQLVPGVTNREIEKICNHNVTRLMAQHSSTEH